MHWYNNGPWEVVNSPLGDVFTENVDNFGQVQCKRDFLYMKDITPFKVKI